MIWVAWAAAFMAGYCFSYAIETNDALLAAFAGILTVQSGWMAAES